MGQIRTGYYLLLDGEILAVDSITFHVVQKTNPMPVYGCSIVLWEISELVLSFPEV